jgi:hypothetical protein
MPKPKKKDSPVGTPITTPTNSPERPPIDNSFAPLQSESEGEEEKTMDTINADEPHLEIESEEHSDYTDAAEDAQATIPRTPPVQTKPAATPEALREKSSGHIASILPTDLERLKESIPLFASDLAKSAGKLFPDDDQEISKPGLTNQVSTLKPPPAASMPQELSPQPRQDKYAHSPYFNSWKRPSIQDRELAEELFGDDAKPPAVPKPPPQRIHADLIAEHNALRLKSLPGSGIVPMSDQHGNKSDDALATDKQLDPVEKLNQSIAQQAAQLQRLQMSLAALKAGQQESQSGDMQEVDMIDAPSDATQQPKNTLDEAMTDAAPSVTKSDAPKHPPSMLVEPSVILDRNRDPNAFILVQHKNSKVVKTLQTSVKTQTQLMPVSAPSNQPDPLTALVQKRPIYPVLPDPTPCRPFFQRTTWRIDIPSKMESPQQGLLEAINEIWSILKDADDKLIIYPWRIRHHGQYKALSGPSKLPTTKDGINRYFTDAYFRPHPGNMYLRVFMGTSISEEELGIRTQYFFGANNKRKRVAVWKNHLQFEDTVEIGWLFRSTPGMSPDTIQKELVAHTGIYAAV